MSSSFNEEATTASKLIFTGNLVAGFFSEVVTEYHYYQWYHYYR